MTNKEAYKGVNDMALNCRQWALYNLLKHNPEKMFKEAEICEELRTFYDFPFTGFGDNFHDSTARQAITADIRKINDDDVIQKIIISTPDGVKLANREEATKFIKAQYSAVFRKLKRIRKLERKAGLDGQFRIVLGKERNVFEAFTDYLIEEKKGR